MFTPNSLTNKEAQNCASEIEQQLLDDCYDPDVFVPITDTEFSNMLATMEQIRQHIDQQKSDNQAI